MAILSLLVVATGCDPNGANRKENSNNQAAMENKPQYDPAYQKKSPEKGDEIAVLETNMGTIKMKFFPEVAPETVKNFQELAKQGKYTEVPVHRVIDEFMIQMGDFEKGNGTGGYSYKGPGTTIKDEPSVKLQHIYGAVSMAKTSMPNTGGSQFFIVEKQSGTPHLNGVHTVFGQVYEGMEIVEKIAAVKTDGFDRPLEPVVLKSVTIETYEGN